MKTTSLASPTVVFGVSGLRHQGLDMLIHGKAVVLVSGFRVRA